VLDQYRDQTEYVVTLASGEQVIVSPELTINRISLIFYSFVNVGALIGIPTAYAEKLSGFWLAFLIPGIIYFLLPLVLVATSKQTYRVQPQGSALDEFFRILLVTFRRSGRKLFRHPQFWQLAKPSVLEQDGFLTEYRGTRITWTDQSVDDVHRTLSACVMFLYFPIWYLNDGGMGAIATSQGGSMTKKGATNDVLGNFNPITVIVFSPLLSFFIYPTLERFNMMPGRVTRITFGFTLAWISSIVGAIIQWHIYQTSPCGYHATKCSQEPGVSPLSVWAQVPIFVLGAISECLCQVTAYEIAYARSPKNMKSLVMAVFLFMNALSSALALIVSPAIKDPNLVWAWVGPAVGMLVLSIAFHRQYRWMNSDEFMTKNARGEPGETTDEKRS
jgi:dipeptide/tripeptide permease